MRAIASGCGGAHERMVEITSIGHGDPVQEDEISDRGWIKRVIIVRSKVNSILRA